MSPGDIVRDVVAASLNSIELVPMSFYKPGALSLTLYIYSEDYCRSCPWSEYYGPRRVFDLRDIPLERVLKRFREIGADILFFSGGDLLERPEAPTVLERIRGSGVSVGVKHRVSKKLRPEALGLIDALLLEVRALDRQDLLEEVLSLVERVSERPHIELLIDEIPEDPVERARTTTWVMEVCRRSRGYRVGFYMADKDERFVSLYTATISRLCGHRYYIVASHHKYLPEEVLCGECGALVGRRVDGVVVRPSIEGTTCPRCGARVFYKSGGGRSRTFFSRVYV